MRVDSLFSLRDKIVVLTGACGLIGKELSSALIKSGSTVIALDINLDALQELSIEINSTNFHTREIDVSSADSIVSLVGYLNSEFSSIDVLINNHQFKPIGFCEATPENFPDELWDQIIDVNLTGTYLMCKNIGKIMLAQKYGSIINFASTYGVVSSNPDLYSDNSLGNPLAYSVSKGGVLMLSKYLGVHWASQGVRVNCITPHGVFNNHEESFVRRFSEKSPMKRMMLANEIVGSIIYLSSDASTYVTGTNLFVEGGWTSW